MIKLFNPQKNLEKIITKYKQLLFYSETSDLPCVAILDDFRLSRPSNGNYDISDIPKR